MISETCPTLAEVMLKWELTHQDQERTIMSAEHNGATYTITHFPENAFKGKPGFYVDVVTREHSRSLGGTRTLKVAEMVASEHAARTPALPT